MEPTMWVQVPVAGTRRTEFVPATLGETMATRTNNTVAANHTAEVTATPLATPLNSEPKPVRLKVIVTLNRDYAEGRITISPAGHTIPPIESVKDFINTPSKRRLIQGLVNNGYNLYQIIYRTQGGTCPIPPQEWAEAVAAALAQRLTLPHEGEALVSSAFNDGMYIAIGDMLMKAVPVQAIQPRNPMPVMRRRILDKAKLDAAAITDAAHKTLSTIEAKILAKRQELERANRNQPIPPSWTTNNGIPVKRLANMNGSNQWAIGIHLSFHVSGFDFHHLQRDGSTTAYRWNARTRSSAAHGRGLPPVHRLMWMPVSANGEFNVTAGFMDAGNFQLPHVSYTSSCQTPGQLPRALSSMDDYNNLRAGLSTCYSRVALHSLLTHYTPEMWGADFNAFIPDALAERLRTHGTDSLYNFAHDSEETLPSPTAAANETWRA